MGRLIVIQHLERERPGLFANIAEERGFSVFTFRLDQGDFLPQLIVGDLLLVLGGPMSIRDIGTSKYPWLTEEVGLIKQAPKSWYWNNRSMLGCSAFSLCRWWWCCNAKGGCI